MNTIPFTFTHIPQYFHAQQTLASIKKLKSIDVQNFLIIRRLVLFNGEQQPWHS